MELKYITYEPCNFGFEPKIVSGAPSTLRPDAPDLAPRRKSPSYNNRHLSQVSDASRRLLEEEEICQSLSNATRKMEADAKKIKEEMAMKEEK